MSDQEAEARLASNLDALKVAMNVNYAASISASKVKYIADRHNKNSAERDCREFIERVVLPQVMNAATQGKYETILTFERCQALAPWTRFTRALADECCARLSTPGFGYEASVADSAMVVRWSAATAYVPRDGEAVFGYPPLVLDARDCKPIPASALHIGGRSEGDGI